MNMHSTPISHRLDDENGLTLVELMVVLAIIIITTAIALPMYISDLPRQKTKAVAQSLLGDLRMARAKAVANNQFYLVCFNNSSSAPSYTLKPETGAAMDCTVGKIEKTVDIKTDYDGVQFNAGSSSQGCKDATGTDPVNFVTDTARFNRMGSSVDGGNNFWEGWVTVTNIRDPNLWTYCVQVEGSTGRATLYKWDKGQWN